MAKKKKVKKQKLITKKRKEKAIKLAKLVGRGATKFGRGAIKTGIAIQAARQEYAKQELELLRRRIEIETAARKLRKLRGKNSKRY